MAKVMSNRSQCSCGGGCGACRGMHAEDEDHEAPGRIPGQPEGALGGELEGEGEFEAQGELEGEGEFTGEGEFEGEGEVNRRYARSRAKTRASGSGFGMRRSARSTKATGSARTSSGLRPRTAARANAYFSKRLGWDRALPSIA